LFACLRAPLMIALPLLAGAMTDSCFSIFVLPQCGQLATVSLRISNSLVLSQTRQWKSNNGMANLVWCASAAPLQDQCRRRQFGTPGFSGHVAGDDCVDIATELVARKVLVLWGEPLIQPTRCGVPIARHRRRSVRARVLARDVSLAVEAPGASSVPQADKVNMRMRLGSEEDGSVLISRITRRSLDLLALQVGQRVFAQVKSVALVT
jgi:hypothetical protein